MSVEPNKLTTQFSQIAPDVNSEEAKKQAKPYAGGKNWDKIGKDINKELEAEKPEGDGALNALFK